MLELDQTSKMLMKQSNSFSIESLLSRTNVKMENQEEMPNSISPPPLIPRAVNGRLMRPPNFHLPSEPPVSPPALQQPSRPGHPFPGLLPPDFFLPQNLPLDLLARSGMIYQNIANFQGNVVCW